MAEKYNILGNIPVLLLHQGIEFIPFTLLRITLLHFLRLRGGHDVVTEWLALNISTYLYGKG